MKKRLLTALLCVFIPFTAFACHRDPVKGPVEKADANALQIGVVKKGYGSDFVYDLAEAFMAQHKDVLVQVVRDTPDTSFVDTSLEIGVRNEIDIYFDIRDNGFFDIAAAGENIVKGYNPVFADLSDVFASPAAGYADLAAGTTVADIMDGWVMDTVTFEGKQYAVPWTLGMEGMVFNKKAWDSANKKLAAGSKLVMPRTTDEMITLFKQIRDDGAISEKPFKYSGTVNYMTIPWAHWWAQYDGLSAVDNFLAGKKADGTYAQNAEIFQYGENGRRYAYDIVRELLGTQGFFDEADQAEQFTSAQIKFLEGRAFFNFNGDWLEREAASNFRPGETDTAFIRVPVVSRLAYTLDSFNAFGGAEKDKKFSEAIDYIDCLDGYTLYERPHTAAEKPAWLSDGDVIRLTEARKAAQINAWSYLTHVPAYSNKLAEAKEFIKFMLSKDGQEIMMKAAYGTRAPLNVGLEQFDYLKSDKASNMAKTKNEIFSKAASFSAYAKKYPMMYISGIQPYGRKTMESGFGGSSAESVSSFMTADYNYYRPLWNDLLSRAGISI